VAMGASLFKPGAWMEGVKSVFGIALLVMSVWFLRPLSRALEDFVIDPAWGMWAGLGLVVAGVAAGAVHLSFHDPGPGRIRKALAVGVTSFGAVVTLNNFLYVPPMSWQSITTMAELEASISEAEADGKPLLIDFAASWCLPCKEMEIQTFHDPTVEPDLAGRFKLVKIDVTDPNDEQDAMKEAFDSGTLPSVLVYSSDAKLSGHFETLRAGKPMPAPSAHFKTFVDAQEFLPAILDVE
jgi:thiol:disulfide interchange protein DsbD